MFRTSTWQDANVGRGNREARNDFRSMRRAVICALAHCAGTAPPSIRMTRRVFGGLVEKLIQEGLPIGRGPCCTVIRRIYRPSRSHMPEHTVTSPCYLPTRSRPSISKHTSAARRSQHAISPDLPVTYGPPALAVLWLVPPRARCCACSLSRSLSSVAELRRPTDELLQSRGEPAARLVRSLDQFCYARSRSLRLSPLHLIC